MRVLISVSVALALSVGASSMAFAKPHLNAAGKCIEDNGKFVKQSLCPAASTAPKPIMCKDGTTSSAKTTKGACSHHGGIKG